MSGRQNYDINPAFSRVFGKEYTVASGTIPEAGPATFLWSMTGYGGPAAVEKKEIKDIAGTSGKKGREYEKHRPPAGNVIIFDSTTGLWFSL